MPAIGSQEFAARPLVLEDLRARLGEKTGPAYWRSLDELAGDPEFEKFLRAEFPQQAAALPEGASTVARRDFLKLMGASLAFAGLAGCTRQPTEKIVPAVKAPEETPGRSQYFATAMPLGGYARGLLVQSHEGRPTKIEGNPQQPASLGATDVFGQASILTLYDPDRSQVIRRVNEISSWNRFSEALETVLAGQDGRQGAGLRLLVGTTTSPALQAGFDAVRERFPAMRVHSWEPVNQDAVRAGTALAFGTSLDAVLKLSEADVIVSLDADFLGHGPDHLRHIRELTGRRRPTGPDYDPSRLYVAESTFTVTGSVADERRPMRAADIEDLARRLAHSFGLPVAAEPETTESSDWAEAVVRDLRAHRGRSLVIAGEGQPPAVHAIAHALNVELGNVGTTVDYIRPVTAAESLSQTDSLRDLVEDMRAGAVEVLVLLDVNPVYDAPADLGFAEALTRVPFSAASGLYDDETAHLCHWHIPAAHFLEAWGDVRSGDGTVTIQQPLIAPLYGGKSPLELVASLAGRGRASGYDVLRAHWANQWGPDSFEQKWERALHDGVVEGTAATRVEPTLSASLGRALGARPPSAPGGLEATIRPHPTIGDGRLANNGWLQECPTPLEKLTWDNVVLIAPETAEAQGVANGDVVEITHGDRRVSGPIWILPGQPAGSLGLQLGYGRTRAGRVGSGRGFDVYALRTTAAPAILSNVTLRKTGETRRLACTQHHGALEGRHVVRPGTVAQYREDPAFAQHVAHEPALDDTLYPNFKYEGHAWGMAIDLNACVGCNACLVACQSENNIPVVGDEQVAMGREMHWIRIDRYWTGEPEAPDAHYQPMLCQHCERAPCEVVCPVNATVHDGEGLNLMVYNRCVGTRYCSNNCPYKVRRFNFSLYSDWDTESLKLQRNPDVTVRSRGVMEKCTYCIQRINKARNVARKEGRSVADGEIVTACQQVCPADAIVFGDINDPDSEVSRRKADPRNYSVLAELNTRPRTTYLASVRNPSEELEGKASGKGGHS